MHFRIPTLVLGTLALLPGVVPAQCTTCLSANFNQTFRPVWSTGIRGVAIEANAGPSTRGICGLDFYMQSRTTNLTMNVSIYDAKGPMNGGVRLATGTMAVGTTLGICSAKFTSPAVVAANARFYIVFDSANLVYWPVANGGTPQTHYRSLNNAWSGPYSTLEWNYRLSCLSGVAASYSPFGTGCKGSPRGCMPTKDMNWSSPAAVRTTTATKLGIFDSTSAQAGLALCGIDLELSGLTATQTLAVAIQALDGMTGLPGKVLGRTTVTVTTTRAVHKAVFSPPIAMQANTPFFVVLDDASKIQLPLATTGTQGVHVTWNGSQWSWSSQSLCWRYRVREDAPATVPVLSTADRPVLGKPFRIALAGARPQTAAWLTLGGSRTAWGSVPLPLHLTPVAPGCWLRASPGFFFGLATDATGSGQVTLPIPSDKALAGVEFYNQYWVLDLAANQLGFVFSNAGAAKIGDF